MESVKTGLVVQHGASRNLVLADGDDPGDDSVLWTCTLRGRLRQGRRQTVRAVVIGDRVRFLPGDDDERQGAIEEVLPRRNQVSRPQPSGGLQKHLEQVVVSNLDRLWVVASLAEPPLNLRFIDRILAATRLQNLDAGLILNKSDLIDRADPTPIREAYEALGYPVHLCSVESGEGLEELGSALSGHIQAFLGLSGVGKSSLLRVVQPGLELRVASVGERHGHGRHTTTASRLFWLSAVRGWVADTPGMREFGLWGVFKKDLAGGFQEISSRAQDCRFRDCMHLTEPNCTVREALAEGEIMEWRYESYQALLEELPVDELDRQGKR